MSLKFMERGTRVEIRIAEAGETFITRVEEIPDEANGRVLLDIVRSGGVEMRLTTNESYTLKFFCERGVYRFVAVMRGYVRKGHFEYMLLQTSGQGEKIQLRKSFRLSCGEEISFTAAESDEVQRGLLRDISAGGVRMLTTCELDQSELLQMELPMIAEGFHAYGAILSKKAMFEGKYNWQYGIEFVGTTNVEAEKIAKYVHCEQRRAMARG